MTLYSVYQRDATPPVVVADRFSWFAALLPPAYALAHRLWLAALFWVAAVLVLAVAAQFIGGEAVFWLYGLGAVLFGFEAQTLRRRRLAGAREAEIIAPDEDTALLTYLKTEA